MTQRYTLERLIEREKVRMETKKESQKRFPHTPTEAALFDFWEDMKTNKAFSISDMPKRVQEVYRKVAELVKEDSAKTKVYAIGSTVNGTYVDKESDEFEIQAYQLMNKKKYSDIDVYIEGDYKKEKLDKIVDVIPFKTGRTILIK